MPARPGRSRGLPARSADTAGLDYDALDQYAGVVQLDQLDDTHAVILVQDDSGAQDLRTIELP